MYIHITCERVECSMVQVHPLVDKEPKSESIVSQEKLMKKLEARLLESMQTDRENSFEKNYYE